MFRSRGENLRSVFILLFLNVAFFLLEHQDPQKYARLFTFDWDAVRAGELWRVVTYQFTQAGNGFMEALSLFITLLLLYMMGSALEEAWGTRHFLTLYALSVVGSAAVAAVLGVTLLGTYFVYFTLLFVYASVFPQQTFYLMLMIPVPVRLLAGFALAVLLYGVVAGGGANAAALGGAAAAYLYYASQRLRSVTQPPAAPQSPDNRIDTTAMHNAARLVAIRQAVAAESDAEVRRMIVQCERDSVQGVNICPPADYKPDAADGYCIRCEGFAECSARHLKAHHARSAAVLTVPGTDVS